MPCGGDRREADYYANISKSQAASQVALLTRLLCFACKRLEENALLTPELREWWIPHQLKDLEMSQKAAKEKKLLDVRNRIAGQLSPIEKEALKKYGL